MVDRHDWARAPGTRPLAPDTGQGGDKAKIPTDLLGNARKGPPSRPVPIGVLYTQQSAVAECLLKLVLR